MMIVVTKALKLAMHTLFIYTHFLQVRNNEILLEIFTRGKVNFAVLVQNVSQHLGHIDDDLYLHLL